MKNKKDMITEKKRQQKERSALREAVGFVSETGLWAGAGALVGIANYFYDFSMKPVKHDPARDGDPDEMPYTKGRIWMNTHPERRDWYERAEDGLRIHANFIPSTVTNPFTVNSFISIFLSFIN